MHKLYPLTFHPVYKDYIWGGTRIIDKYGRRAPAGIYAESWEITDRRESISLVANGDLAGKSLHQLVKIYGTALLGRSSAFFPLLVKLIDAKDRLSVQVHPDEKTVVTVGGEPKTEAWYVLDAEPGARVYAGFKAGVKKEGFLTALMHCKVADLLKAIPVTRGDVIYVPGGCIHSIGPGCLLLEIQQNSDTTFRVYDWNRHSRGGRERPLHVEQALQVIKWRKISEARHGIRHAPEIKQPRDRWVMTLLECPYFLVEKIVLIEKAPCSYPMDGKSFHILFVESGEISIHAQGVRVVAKAGTTVLIPAALKEYELQQKHSYGQLIRIRLP